MKNLFNHGMSLIFFCHNSANHENLKNGEEFRFRDEMAAIARDPDAEHLFSISHFDDFSRIEDDIVSRTCREAPPGNIDYMMSSFSIRHWGCDNC